MHRPIFLFLVATGDLFKHLHELVKVDGLQFGFHIDTCCKRLHFFENVAALFLLEFAILHLLEGLNHRLVFLVLQKVLHQLFPGVDFISVFVKLRPRQKHPGFDAHQCGGHQDKLTGQLYIEGLQLVEVVKKIIGDLGDRDVVYIQLIAFDEEQQEVKRTFKQREFNFEILSSHCGSTRSPRAAQNYSNTEQKSRDRANCVDLG